MSGHTAPDERSAAIDRDLKTIIDRLRKSGWRIRTGRTHLKLLGPRGQLVCCHKTASDSRAIRNLRARLRRHGADL